MTAPLLTTKLYIPPLRPDWLQRPQLFARLDAGLYRKLTLISAPAGAGKTTLASAWLSRLRTPGAEGAPAHDVAWLTLDDNDSELARFFAYLLAALATIDAALGQDVRRMVEAPQLPLRTLVTALINDLAAHPASLVLVLDDYHTIDELAVHQALGMLIEYQPANLHLVLVTRHDPPLPLAQLRAHGQLTEIRQGDLRLSTEETAGFLNESMGLQLSPADVALLETRTEGWIAGLQLAALSLQGRDPSSRAEFIAGFSGRYHFLLDYLTDEVLARQPETIQTFMLRTSILRRMCGPLCDAVLGDWETGKSVDGEQRSSDQPARLPTAGFPASRSAVILDLLDHANLFLTPLDDERRWYRYHSLFGELLQARLQETQAGQIPELHRRAVAWYEQEGLAVEAVHHALFSQDHVLAAAVIERAITRISTWSRADIAMIRRWLNALPDDVTRDRPWLRLFASRSLYVSGQPEAASRVLQELESWLREHPEAPEAGRLLGLVTVDRASYAAVVGDVQQAQELARQALADASPGDPIARFRAPAILGMAALRAGQVVEAQRLFSDAADLTLEAGLGFAGLIFFCNLAETLVLQGRLHQGVQACERALQLGTVEGGRIYASGFVGLELGKVLYEWNDLSAAERRLLEGLELLTGGGISASFGSIHAVLAQVKQARGDTAGALDAARQAVESAQRDGIPRLHILTLAYQARVWLAQGQLDLAAAWARTYRQVGATQYLREFEDLTLVRVLLDEDRAAEALALLTPMLSAAGDAGRGAAVIEIQALRALALRAQNELEEALEALRQALTLAEPEGYLRLFVDMGRPMVELLKVAGSHGLLPQYVARLLAACAPDEPAQLGLERQPLVEPLTERELAVLQLLAEHLSNREIGRRLVISLPTVKSHTRSIYGKLGVDSREQAVARARALAILPSP